MSEILFKALDRLRPKLRQLIERHLDLQEKLENLRKENMGLRFENESLKEDLKRFQNQEKITKIVESVVVDEEKQDKRVTELKLKINQYIKEIDRCILHLSQ